MKIYVSNGRIYAKPTIHLKSAIPGFHRKNIAKQIALDLLKRMVV